MVVERAATSTSVVDVLDHVLDKGIVIDGWEGHIVVASLETYNKHVDPMSPRGDPVLRQLREGLPSLKISV